MGKFNQNFYPEYCMCIYTQVCVLRESLDELVPRFQRRGEPKSWTEKFRISQWCFKVSFASNIQLCCGFHLIPGTTSRGRSSASKVEYAKRFSLKKLILSLKLYKLSKMNIFQMLRKQGICFQLSIIKARNAFSHLWQRKTEHWRSRSTEGIKVIYPQGKARSQGKCREIKSHTGTFSIREFIYSILRMFCIFTWAIHLFIPYWEL